MSSQPDDLDAVRTISNALSAFDPKEQERILRWVKEKLGLRATMGAEETLPAAEAPSQPSASHSTHARALDIKSFVEQKNPQTDNQFAATIAYYYRFEAPEAQRKDSITASDIQEACRRASRERMSRPAQTLVNAHAQGYLDKGAERGTYVINTVGENLVAMTLPQGNVNRPATTARKKTNRRKTRR